MLMDRPRHWGTACGGVFCLCPWEVIHLHVNKHDFNWPLKTRWSLFVLIGPSLQPNGVCAWGVAYLNCAESKIKLTSTLESICVIWVWSLLSRRAYNGMVCVCVRTTSKLINNEWNWPLIGARVRRSDSPYTSLKLNSLRVCQEWYKQMLLNIK